MCWPSGSKSATVAKGRGRWKFVRSTWLVFGKCVQTCYIDKVEIRLLGPHMQFELMLVLYFM